MRRPLLAAFSAAAAVCVSTLGLTSTASAAPSPTGLHHRPVAVCDHTTAKAGDASCDAIRDDTVNADGALVQPQAVAPAGYGPSDIRSAYNLTGASSGGTWVAIVDAYDAPTAEQDLAVYRKQFGLPECSTATGCFKKVSQTGSTTTLPRPNGGWAQEISLDLDMVSAACPDCKILLVEARSASFSDLSAAVRYAASQHPVAISNSYGGSDTNNATIAAAYNQPGIAVTASTGDGGYAVSSPASLPGVVAVGGTSLNRASTTRGWSEAAWSGAGSGCSTLNAKPGYQNGTSCNGKATADVSAVADPNTGVAVYDSYAYQGASGWMVFGGTSASAPIIAGVYAQGSAVRSAATVPATTWAKAGTADFNDVTRGSNGACSPAVWCTSGAGWDGPTGLGTPNGVGAF